MAMTYEKRKMIQELLIGWNLDITEPLPDGTIPRLLNELPSYYDQHDIANALTIIKTVAAKKVQVKPFNPTTIHFPKKKELTTSKKYTSTDAAMKKKVKDIVQNYIGKRLPRGFIINFANENGISLNHGSYLFKSTRKKNGGY